MAKKDLDDKEIRIRKATKELKSLVNYSILAVKKIFLKFLIFLVDF